jgi:3',5'-nucleoside bisphosphate phosphatase
MAGPRFDLQSHSTHSDGALAPAAVVDRAAAAGIELLALTDHDTVDGVDEALDQARRVGIELVPAVEISATDEVHGELHILGYGIDHAGEDLRDALAAARRDRVARAERMVDALRDAGWAIDDVALRRRRAGDRPIGRPHLAEAVFAHPDNAARLREEGLTTATDVLVAYLIPGAPAYRDRTRPTVVDAIVTIHAAGGIAVWAHPFWDVDDADEVVEALERFVAQGIDGVEAFYVTHTEEQVRLLHATAVRLGLQATGSADFHGPDHPRFSRFGAFALYGLEPRLDRLVA